MLKSVEFWQLMIPIGAAIVAWLANEWRKQAWENFLRKERYYQALLSRTDAFFQTGTEEDRREFLKQLNLCWLYCPDDVIRKVYAFLNTVHEKYQGTDTQRKDSLRELVVAIRKDLFPWYRRTALRPSDFQILRIK